MAVLVRERSPSLWRHWRWLLLVLAGLAIVGAAGWGVWRWALAPAADALLEPLPQDPHIQVFFNQSQAARYTEAYRPQERLGDDLEAIVIGAIASAQRSVDIAVQELRLPGIAWALVERHRAGVQVRVILEDSYRRPLSQISAPELAAMEDRDRARYVDGMQIIDQDQDGQLSQAEINQNDALMILQNAGIPILDDRADGSRGSDLMHHKFVVVDQRWVVMGSANFTPSDMHGDFLKPDSRGNPNHLIRIDSIEVARLFAQEFALLWGDGVGQLPNSYFGLQKPYRPPSRVMVRPDAAVTVQFSPISPTQNWWNSGNGLIGNTLNRAQQRVDFALFVFSDQNLSNILGVRQQQGVTVRGVIDESFIFRSYSEGLDLLGVALPDDRCRLEAENRPWGGAIATLGTPTLPDGDLLHHKFAVVDGRWVITGSQNWSDAANHSNDENVVVIENATVAAHFEREFERLYGTAALGVPLALQERIQQQSARCGRP